MSQAATRFALGTFAHAPLTARHTSATNAFAGLVIGERVYPLQQFAAHLPTGCATLLQLLEHWSHAFESLQAVANTLTADETGLPLYHAFDELTALPPVDLPRQVFCSGANYFKHVVDLIVDLGPGATPGTEGMDAHTLRAFAENMMRERALHGTPYMFMKPVSSISGACAAIPLPAWAQQPDWELELGVVIGKPTHRVSRERALEHVAGYVIVNDISNRDTIWRRDHAKAMGTDWVAGKGQPGYLPIGPLLVPAPFVADPQDLRITLRLNGEIKQNESTADMIFSVARQIEYLSHLVELWPGDVLCTGSPAGNGTHYKRFLEPGDLVESTISGLGTQRNAVVAAPR